MGLLEDIPMMESSTNSLYYIASNLQCSRIILSTNHCVVYTLPYFLAAYKICPFPRYRENENFSCSDFAKRIEPKKRTSELVTRFFPFQAPPSYRHEGKLPHNFHFSQSSLLNVVIGWKQTPFKIPVHAHCCALHRAEATL